MSLRTVAVTQDDPFFTGRFFATFLPAARPAGVEVVQIVLLPNFNESRVALARRLAGFYPPVDLARLAARYVRARLGERAGVLRGVERIAARHGVPARRRASVNDPDFHRWLREQRVDVLLSVAAPEIFRPATLRAVPHVLNVHNGRLPDYRGMMPTFWALLDGADHVVVTVHEMAERLDAGPVVAEYPVAVRARDSAFDVAVAAKAAAGRAVAELLGSGAWPPAREIDVAAGRYRPFPSRRDAARLRAAGRRLL
jgi:methionyl-tRNA formyltransferase